MIMIIILYLLLSRVAMEVIRTSDWKINAFVFAFGPLVLIISGIMMYVLDFSDKMRKYELNKFK